MAFLSLLATAAGLALPDVPPTVLPVPRFADDIQCSWQPLDNALLPGLALPAGPLSLAAQAAAQAYHAAGLVTIRIKPLTDSCQIKIYELTAKGVGPYSTYVSRKVLTQADLAVIAARIAAAAEARNQSVKITLGAADYEAGTLEIVTEVTAAAPAASGNSMQIGSSGSRYTSADTATITSRTTLPDLGIKLEGSVSRGLADLRADSKGGAFESISLRGETTFASATYALELSGSTYKVGGIYREFALGGSNIKASLVAARPVLPGLALESRSSYVMSATTLDALKAREKVSYMSEYTGLKYIEVAGPLDLSVSAGAFATFGLKKEIGVIPLGEAVKASTFGARGDISLGLQLSDTYANRYITGLKLTVAGQKAPAGVPGYEQFYIGGEGRGNASPSGQYAGPSGVAAGLRAYGPRFFVQDYRVVPFAGINGGRVTPDVGSSKSTGAVEFGVSVAGKLAQAQVAFALPIVRDAAEKPRLNFAVNLPF